MIAVTVAFVVALVVTSAATPAALKLAVRFGAVAVPRSRDVHTTPMPRLGGVAIYAGVLAATLITVTARHFITHGVHGWTLHLVGVLVAGTFMALMGIADDLKDLKPLYQAAAIVAAGSVLVLFGVRIEGITNPLLAQTPGAWRWIELPLWLSVFSTLFWVFVVTKTVDAIDGLDGLAAGVCAISAGTLALLAAASHQPEGPTVALLAASVAGSCVGFLKYNHYPARIFMSTVGAQFLGLMLASISILGTFKIAAAISVLVPLLVLGVPIFDYAAVLVRRMVSRAPLTAGDRRHLHHRLLERGLTHRQAVWVIYGCTALLCAAALLIFRASH
ncbi:MAG: MraY family glycosyltransferase [Chthonomonadales bacterium]